MKYFDTNDMVRKHFEDGTLPTLSYIYHHQRDENYIIRPLHKHQDICEIVLVYEGNCIYYHNEIPYSCPAGTIICTNQDELHELIMDQTQRASWFSVGIKNLRIKGLMKNHLIRQDEPCLLPSNNNYTLLLHTLQEIYKIADRDHDTNLLVQMMCTVLVLTVNKVWMQRENFSTKDNNQNLSKRIVDYMNEHFTDEDISISVIATALNCSETHISHLFKKISGQSPKQYIIRRRIGLAQTLLISTDLSVTEIASQVGYNNTNYFSTIYADYTGVTPGKYRKLYKQKAKGTYYQL